MRRTIRLASILTIAAIITPAYLHAAQNKDAARDPAASEACSLLTKEDAAAALGEGVTGPKAISNRQSGPGMTVSSCEYTGSGLGKVHLNVMHFPADQAAVYKGFCAQKTKDGLTGLGDVTCWYDNKHEELQVLKGTTLLSIELRGKPNPTEAIKGVMKKVYDRLR